MEIITSIADFNQAKSKHLIKLKCQKCLDIFEITKDRVQGNAAQGGNAGCFCSMKCAASRQGIDKYKIFSCAQCGSPVKKRISKTSKSGTKANKSNRKFCNLSCSTKYNNAHKTHGCRRSKLEVYLQNQLTLLYPTLEIHYNRKNAILSELDIFIPSIKLAIELNGILHYEPIFSQEKLQQIQNNDNRKFQACLERGIELAIIDSSKLNYFKEQNAKPFLDMIVKLIQGKI